MSAPDPDVSWVQWVLGGLAAAMLSLATSVLGAVVWLYAVIQSVRKESRTGDDALWVRVNRQGQDAAGAALRAEERYASKGDLDRQTLRLEKRMDDSVALVIQAIKDRGPAR